MTITEEKEVVITMYDNDTRESLLPYTGKLGKNREHGECNFVGLSVGGAIIIEKKLCEFFAVDHVIIKL